MLDKLTSADFSAHLNQKFRVRYQPEAALEVELIEVVKLGPEDMPGRRPFSIIFRSLERNRYLPQHIYTVEHDQMEKMELFLVPLGPDETGMRYEAVFT